jgi:hypothetical protein
LYSVQPLLDGLDLRFVKKPRDPDTAPGSQSALSDDVLTPMRRLPQNVRDLGNRYQSHFLNSLQKKPLFYKASLTVKP